MNRDEIIEAGARAEYERERAYMSSNGVGMPLWEDVNPYARKLALAEAGRYLDAMEPLIRAQAIADNDREWCSIIEAATVRPDDVTFTTAVMAAIRADERRKVAAELREVADEQQGWLWFELGESALHKVAAYIEPRDHAKTEGEQR